MVLEEKLLIEPYVYQVPCIGAVKKALQERDEALFVMAMGLGKTVTSAFIVEEWLNSGKRGLFLCHETYILEHVEQEYRKVIEKEIVYKTFYGSEAEGKKDWTADSADMLFASFQSLNNWHGQWYQVFDRNHFDFIVVDESHHGQAPSYKEVIDYFDCKKIGMTATPDRMDLKDIREIFGEEVFTISLEEGIANGWLANVEYHILSDGINNGKLKKICHDVLEEGKRVSIKQINETIFIHERDKAESLIIEEYTKIKEYSGDRKTLLFCERTTHADNLIPHFERSGVMHSKKSWKENDHVFKGFESGDLQYVASVNKFNEGKHVPGVEVIVFLRATDSLTIFWQQLGRALAKIGGKQKVIVLDFVSNIERLIMIRDMMLRIKQIQEGLVPASPEKPQLDTQPFHVSGEGFDFIFSDELVDVMKIIEALRKGYYETWQEAGKAAQGLGIKTRKEYQQIYKKDLRLPSAPQVIYGQDFPGYPVFLGIEDEIFHPTMEKAIEALRENGITDYWSLVQCKVRTFYDFRFGRFGKGTGLTTFILGEPANASFEVMLKVSDKLGWTPKEEDKIARYKQEFAKHKITDYWTLATKSMVQFSKLKFGKFGGVGDFYYTVFGQNLNESGLVSNTSQIKDRFTEKFGWTVTEDQKMDKLKAELASHGVTDYWTLKFFGAGKFQVTKWGVFGKGKSLLGFFFKEFKDVRKLGEGFVERLAALMGWTPTKEDRINRYREEFARHGITDYWTLSQTPYPGVIRKASFGKFGMGFKFCSTVLGKTADKFSHEERTEALAKKLGWTPTKKERLAQKEKRVQLYKDALAKHGITDYWSLVLRDHFEKLDFGLLGKSKAFLTAVIERDFYCIKNEILIEAAEKLGWIPTEDQKFQRYKAELLKHNITDYWSLVSFQAHGFISLRFGLFLGGGSFFKTVTGKTLKEDASLNELADKMGWGLTEEQKLPMYRQALIKNNIKDYWDLLLVGIDEFRELDFGFFGKGTAFCCRVLNKSLSSISKAQRLEVADKLGWTPSDEEKNARYREELAKNGISSISDMDSIRTDHFTLLEFGAFGRARLFMNCVLGGVVGAKKPITRQLMTELAQKVGLK